MRTCKTVFGTKFISWERIFCFWQAFWVIRVCTTLATFFGRVEWEKVFWYDNHDVRSLLGVWEECVSSLHCVAHEALCIPPLMSMLPASGKHSVSVWGVVFPHFTLLPLARTQNFSLHNSTDSIYGWVSVSVNCIMMCVWYSKFMIFKNNLGCIFSELLPFLLLTFPENLRVIRTPRPLRRFNRGRDGKFFKI